jgi:hypothetical protein
MRLTRSVAALLGILTLVPYLWVALARFALMPVYWYRCVWAAPAKEAA